MHCEIGHSARKLPKTNTFCCQLPIIRRNFVRFHSASNEPIQYHNILKKPKHEKTIQKKINNITQVTVRFNGNQWEWSAHLTFNLQSGALQNFKYVQAQFEYSKSYRKRSKIEVNKSDRLISGFVLYSSSCILLQRHQNKTEARSSKAFCVFLRRILSTESINSEINQSNENSSSYREIIRIYEIKNTHRFSIFLACRTRKVRKIQRERIPPSGGVGCTVRHRPSSSQHGRPIVCGSTSSLHELHGVSTQRTSLWSVLEIFEAISQRVDEEDD